MDKRKIHCLKSLMCTFFHIKQTKIGTSVESISLLFVVAQFSLILSRLHTAKLTSPIITTHNLHSVYIEPNQDTTSQ